MACTIERIEISQNPVPHNMVSRILALENTALAAVGTAACIRTLWFRAHRIGKLHRFYGAVVSETEYVFGKQILRLKECIQKALEDKTIEHIVVYVSCFEIITMCDLEAELAELELPEHVNLHIFYRGPLAKRTMDTEKNLQKIEAQIKLETRSKECWQSKEMLPPELPDFAKIMLELREKDCDVLLLSPGGCKSCIEECTFEGFFPLKEKGADLYTTRVDDLSLSQGCPELFGVIMETFSQDRLLILVESTAFRMIGFDSQNLAERLSQAGRRTVWMRKLD